MAERTGPGERVRVQLDFSKDAYDRVLELQRKSGANTFADTIRKSLMVFEWYLDKQGGGGEGIAVPKDEDVPGAIVENRPSM